MNLYKLAFNNIRRRKLRSALTMMGIIIGVATIVVLLGVASGGTSAVEDETSGYMYDVAITASASSGSWLMDNATISKVRNSSKLYDFEETSQFTKTIKDKTVFVTGVQNWKTVKLSKGSPGVVITQTMAEKLNYTIGDKITIKNKELTITGISKDEEMAIGINQDLAKKMMDGKVSTITAKTNGDPKTIAKQVQKDIDGITVKTKSQKVAEVQEMKNKALLFIGLIASVSLIVGVISVINTMLISVMERTKELGILKAIGFTNREIKGSILFESGIIGFLGSIFGVILGIIGIIFAANIMDFSEYLPYMMPAWLIIGSIIGATILSVLAGLYPSIKASKMNVVEALRNE